MLELPEVINIARQFNEKLVGRQVRRVRPPSKEHKFCWFSGDPLTYDSRLAGSTLTEAAGFGIYAEMAFDNGLHLCISDGVQVRLADNAELPDNYQLLIDLDNGQALVFTVAMYGGILLHDGHLDNDYYRRSREVISPFSSEFPAVYRQTLASCKPMLSAKAFLATEQRFPGIGNGVLQDILWDAGLHPKRKVASLSTTEQQTLLTSLVSVLQEMTRLGGRDTERDLFGQPGGYQTKMSRNTLSGGCPRCGRSIVKEAYLGGAVYYCPDCQPLLAGGR